MGFRAVSVVSAINLQGKVITTLLTDQAINAETFKKFLHNLRLNSTLSETIYVYLDNLRLHHTNQIKQFCSLNNIVLVFAPPYSSEFNPIERLWALSKQLFTKKIAIIEPVNQIEVRRLVEESIEQSQ
jgi:transposase